MPSQMHAYSKRAILEKRWTIAMWFVFVLCFGLFFVVLCSNDTGACDGRGSSSMGSGDVGENQTGVRG